MQYLKSFNEGLLESLLNESVLYFSPILRDKLVRMNNDISKKLIELEGKDISSDVTFVDISNEENDILFSFMPMNKAITKIKSFYPNASDGDLQNKPDIEINDLIYNRDLSREKKVGIYNPDRNKIKIGKFIKKVLNTLSDKEVESFVNDFKKNILSVDVELVSGKDISFWYDSKNYEINKGTLGSSCMGKEECSFYNFFKIYEDNPDVCKLAIIKNGDKLVARALVWKVECDNKSIKWYMDRPYSTMAYYTTMLEEWGEKNGMALWDGYRVRFRGSSIFVNMRVKVKRVEYDSYPYLDTFKRYDYRKGYLYNDSSDKRGYTLTSTIGGYNKNYRTKLQRFGDYFGIGENLES
jgi:hypothetical protein